MSCSKQGGGQAKGEIKGGMEKHKKRRGVHPAILSVSAGKYLQVSIKWEVLAKDVGVGPAYLKEVLCGRRMGSVDLLLKIAGRLSGGQQVVCENLYRLLLSSERGKR